MPINNDLWYNSGEVIFMAKKAKRDWITNEEAAQMLGISRDYFFKMYCQRFPPLNSVCVGRVWLHYLPDVLKILERRKRDPRNLKGTGGKKAAAITPSFPEAEADEAGAKPDNDTPEA